TVYCAGGIVPAATSKFFAGTNQVFKFDPGANHWKLLPGGLSVPRGAMAACAIGNTGYLCGGWDINSGATYNVAENLPSDAATSSLFENKLLICLINLLHRQ